MVKSMRAVLESKKEYRLHGESEKYLCMGHRFDTYSDSTYVLMNVDSRWRFIAHGVNMYSDGSIDWDFSTHGYFDIPLCRI